MTELYLMGGFFFLIYFGCEWVLTRLPESDRVEDHKEAR